MSRKTSKKQASSHEKQKPIRSQYNLPKQPNYMRNVTYFGCVIKSWRSPSRQCTTSLSRRPTLVEIHGKYDSFWDGIYICHIVDCKRWCKTGYITMGVTGDCSPAFAYHSRRSFETTSYKVRGFCYKPHWIIEYCNVKEPYAPSQNMRFCSVIAFEGRFYAMSLQGSVVVIEEEVVGSDRLRITRIGGNRAVPSDQASRHFREYIFESDGEIILVLLISRESIKVVDDVEVFRLDIEKLLWVKMGKIGNRALFVEDKRCMWTEACEMGFKRDCIYFTHNWVDDWMVFDMKTGIILPAFG